MIEHLENSSVYSCYSLLCFYNTHSFFFQNACHCKPCPGKYALCQVGFTDKGFRCNCREGYRGERCNEGNVFIDIFNLYP